ncbi:MAG: GH92 family glycosyl hydrolase [Bacteroidales bacterium]|nr:GH92 family glycosyl hydrolase [Bacteroidales bacterium]
MGKIVFLSFLVITLGFRSAENKVIWQIGENDNSSSEFAMAPNGYAKFIENDFGWEDKYFLIGTSDIKNNWPYIIPGTGDSWGGTDVNSGRRSSVLNILFGLKNMEQSGDWKLTIDILDCNPKDLPLLKVTVNGTSWKYRIPVINKKSRIDSAIKESSEYLVVIKIPDGLLTEGGNEINLSIIDGSWLKFDQVKLEGPQQVTLTENKQAFVRSVKPSDYEIKTDSGTSQPLLVDLEHLSGQPKLKVVIDGTELLSETLETGRYIFEVPMPSVDAAKQSIYEIFVGDRKIQSGTILRSPQKLKTTAGYVDTKMGTAHSRWMIAPGPWMPFSMVKLSPDNQDWGWQAGYDPTIESISSFSHVHEWTMAGLGTMPANGKLRTKTGKQNSEHGGYRSSINKKTEQAPPGYYKVELTDYNITAELTSTTRCGFQRYTFPKDRDSSRVLLDFIIPAENPYLSLGTYVKKIDDHTIEGYSHQKAPFVWGVGVSQEYTLYFVAEFDRPIKGFKTWTKLGIKKKNERRKKRALDFGAIAEFDTKENNVVQLRTGISFVSIENARENLNKEIKESYGWSFEAVRQANVDAWDNLLERIQITTNDQREKTRFYTNMYRALCSRNTFSDVNGEWTDATEKKQKMDDPSSPALGCDAFWNSFWNLNQFWNLITPEWSNRWVKSQLAMYDANGWLAKGPAGMEYIPVMVAEHEIPLIVGAYQMGIRDFDADKAFEAVLKIQTTPAQKIGGGLTGNEDLVSYLKYHFVPYNKGRFSNTMEYAYDDWTVSQFAKSLRKQKEFIVFEKRGNYWKNAIDTTIGFARMKNSKGEWLKDFDPSKSGANKQYVEGNAWQLTFFVPQDIPSLARIIGKDKFIERLDCGFEESYKTRFNGLNDQYWDYPVVQGNQQSMHFAYLFNWVQQPWLTQKWSRAVIDRYYGYGEANAYLGDEDQGQMSAWFIMSSIGLFQTDGGCRVDPVYEIGSPLYPKVEIDLGQKFGRGKKFVIEAPNASRLNKYVQSAILNGKTLNSFRFPASELLKGGTLILEMGTEPNKKWGIQSISD